MWGGERALFHQRFHRCIGSVEGRRIYIYTHVASCGMIRRRRKPSATRRLKRPMVLQHSPKKGTKDESWRSIPTFASCFFRLYRSVSRIGLAPGKTDGSLTAHTAQSPSNKAHPSVSPNPFPTRTFPHRYRPSRLAIHNTSLHRRSSVAVSLSSSLLDGAMAVYVYIIVCWVNVRVDQHIHNTTYKEPTPNHHNHKQLNQPIPQTHVRSAR